MYNFLDKHRYVTFKRYLKFVCLQLRHLILLCEFFSPFESLSVSLPTTTPNIQKFYMALALRSVFCTVLRTDSGLCCIRH
jgi:hypothetical protein